MISNSPENSSPATSAGQIAQQRAFDICVRKTRGNIQSIADDPKSAAWADDGNYFAFPEGFFEIGNWTSSFFTGMALIAWQETEDEYFLQQTLRLAPAYRRKAIVLHLDMHHDAGFLYSLYSIALYKLTGDRSHRDLGIAAADALYQRFNPQGGFIRAWGRLDTNEHDNMAIIDCMMNLPLFYWASLETGEPKYREAAIRQADNTLRYFIRADDSVNHAFRFDLKTGHPLGPDNYCGNAVDSYWARGASWAIYGFALSYRYTGDKKYLNASLRVLRKFLAQLDAEVVPVWDFRLPADSAQVRDASAAAIVACGIQELQKLGAADTIQIKAKDALLNILCGARYLNDDTNCCGVLRNGFGSKVAYSSWGDYFLMEALARELHQFEPWW
jgi:unsaturated chondroitin disaccharide hydrolase